MKKLIALGLTASLLLSMSVVTAAAPVNNAAGDAAIEFRRDPGMPPDGVYEHGLTGARLDFGVHNIGTTITEQTFNAVISRLNPPAVRIVAVGTDVISNWRVTAELSDFNVGFTGAMLTLRAADAQSNQLGGSRGPVSVDLVAGGYPAPFLSQNGRSTDILMDLSESTLLVRENTAALGQSQAVLTFTFIQNAY